jgi:hypothetical protein
MGVRDMLGRAGCAVGLHGGQWEWVKDGSCEQVRGCPHCGNTKTRTEHGLSEWAYVDQEDTASCLMERHCARCGLTEESARHEPRWRYESVDGCAGQLFCVRCDAPSGKPGVRHDWGPYMPDRDSVSVRNPLARGTTMVRTCRRCANWEPLR